ncbi:rhodanese-like domain-containing protein [Escherichia coli]|uniref:rhodanese-like domain-containing protein n=1 Tax=Escherichia coli TaxID=562 RepID=UPI001D184EFB|nr:rhodanese-like domain-containing protein [Escherichia coli]MCC4040673.1 rhodanese-like domain-containing protein [Escherichia coli]
MRYVTEFTAAKPDVAEAHFLMRLSVETDCADVYDSLAYIGDDFVLLHVVGREEDFARRHVPGAIHLPHKQMTEERMAQWSEDTLFVVYCAGPHCNGADRAALKLARLGRPVKIMIGGVTGWEDEGYAFATGK